MLCDDLTINTVMWSKTFLRESSVVTKLIVKT